MSECPINESKPVKTLRQYVRRPDREFWAQLFKALPEATEGARVRRERVTRYVLGATALISFFYSFPALIVNAEALWLLAAINAVALVIYGFGMWMASLGLPDAPRRILVMTLAAQVGILQIVTANHLFIVVFAPMVAVLARVLIPNSSASVRALLYIYTIALLLHAIYVAHPPLIDVSLYPQDLLSVTRFGNAVIALVGVMLLLTTYEREVLISEMNLQVEKERSDRLLNVILPASIAAELRQSQHMIANRHPEVTVLFADIAGFTPWSSTRTPEEVVALLEKIFSRFDHLVETIRAEKIKTIGDAYMVISGAPEPTHDHAHIIADLALAMMEDVQKIREETGIDLNLRVGIHTGEVIAGVIGAVRFSYDVWGDTVNTASRMESHGEPGRIQISEETYHHLAGDYACTFRGEVNVKGKGAMRTWWLESAKKSDA